MWNAIRKIHFCHRTEDKKTLCYCKNRKSASVIMNPNQVTCKDCLRKLNRLALEKNHVDIANKLMARYVAMGGDKKVAYVLNPNAVESANENTLPLKG